MAISVVAGSIAANNSTSVPVPTGTHAGDLLVLYAFTGFAATGGSAPVAPTGWTTIVSGAFNGSGSSTGQVIATRIASASEPASYSFTAGSGTTPFNDGSMIALRSSLGAALVAHASSTAGGNLSSVTLSGLQLLQPGEMSWILADSGNDQTMTMPAGYTTLASATDHTNGGQQCAYKLWGGTGGTGPQTYTVSTADIEAAAHILVREVLPAYQTATPSPFSWPVLLPRAAVAPFALATPLGDAWPELAGATSSGSVNITATFTGVGSLSVTPLTVQLNSVVLAGVGSLAATPLTVQLNSVVLSGFGSLAASPLTVLLNTVVLAGAGSLAASPLTVLLNAIALSGVGSLAATPLTMQLVSITLSGVGSLTATPLTVQLVSVNLAGVGALLVAPLTVQLVSITMSGVGSLTAAPLSVQLVSITLAGNGALAASPLTVLLIGVTLSGVGLLATTLSIGGGISVSATLSGVGSLAAAPLTVQFGALVVLAGIGALAATITTTSGTTPTRVAAILFGSDGLATLEGPDGHLVLAGADGAAWLEGSDGRVSLFGPDGIALLNTS